MDYNKIVKKNIINIFKDVLKEIEKNGLNSNQSLYITFNTEDKNIIIPDWLKNKYPNKMTIIIQYEYWNLKIKNNSFLINLSFENIKVDLNIPYNSIISFVDPASNFGFNFAEGNKLDNSIKNKVGNKIKKNKNNVIDFKKFKKN